MGLRLCFLPKFPGAKFIQGATFIPDTRVGGFFCNRTMISAFLFDLAFLMKDATKKHICIL